MQRKILITTATTIIIKTTEIKTPVRITTIIIETIITTITEITAILTRIITIIITIIETTITILRRITISIITIITLMARRIRRTRVVRSRHLLLQSSQKYRKFLKLLFQKASALRI